MSNCLSSFALLLAGCLVACGGKATPADDTTADTDTPSDTAAPSEGGVEDVAPGDSSAKPDSPPPSKDTCAKFVASMCSDKTRTCCGTTGIAWNEDGCRANNDYYCNALVDQVTLGRATYDESFLDACLRGWEANYTACQVDGITSAKNQIPCTHLFNGTKKLGETCTGKALVECEAPPGFGAYCEIRTGESSGKCRAYGFVGKDQPCNYYGTTVRYCDTGLYCDLTSTTPTCKTAKAVGAACDGADDFSCGLNFVCKANKCTALAAAGEPCTAREECASYECVDGKCTKAESAAVSAWICGSM